MVYIEILSNDVEAENAENLDSNTVKKVPEKKSEPFKQHETVRSAENEAGTNYVAPKIEEKSAPMKEQETVSRHEEKKADKNEVAHDAEAKNVLLRESETVRQAAENEEDKNNVLREKKSVGTEKAAVRKEEEEEIPVTTDNVEGEHETGTKAQSGTKWEKGFLNDNNTPLYGPEGSAQGKVSEEQKRKWKEHELNEKMNKKMGFGTEDSEYPKPDWYTYDWPKGCQYNKPDCNMFPLEETKHQSDLHREMNRNNDRWKALMEGKVEAACRLSFIGINDEDLGELIQAIRDSEIVEELDLSHNNISDQGVQNLVGSMVNGGFPRLKELKIYANKFTHLGTTMLSQGLRILRKNLTVHLEDPLGKYLNQG